MTDGPLGAREELDILAIPTTGGFGRAFHLRNEERLKAGLDRMTAIRDTAGPVSRSLSIAIRGRPPKTALPAVDPIPVARAGQARAGAASTPA